MSSCLCVGAHCTSGLETSFFLHRLGGGNRWNGLLRAQTYPWQVHWYVVWQSWTTGVKLTKPGWNSVSARIQIIQTHITRKYFCLINGLHRCVSCTCPYRHLSWKTGKQSYSKMTVKNSPNSITALITYENIPLTPVYLLIYFPPQNTFWKESGIFHHSKVG